MNEYQKSLKQISKKQARKRSWGLLKDPFVLIFYIVMILYVITLLFPTAWLIYTTFVPHLEFTMQPFGWSEELTMENYFLVFSRFFVQLPASVERAGFWKLLYNGLSYALLSPLCGLTANVLVAYGCARFKSKVGGILYGFVIVTMILTVPGSLGATINYYKKLGIYNNFIGILISHMGWGGSNFLILYGVLKGIPASYSEAAELDGASQWSILVKIMLPMLTTTLTALFILSFIGVWNDYMTPMVYLPSRPTIAYGLFVFRNSSDSYVAQIPTQLAAIVIVMLPVFILFMLMKNKIMGNLVLGGIKG